MLQHAWGHQVTILSTSTLNASPPRSATPGDDARARTHPLSRLRASGRVLAGASQPSFYQLPPYRPSSYQLPPYQPSSCQLPPYPILPTAALSCQLPPHKTPNSGKETTSPAPPAFPLSRQSRPDSGLGFQGKVSRCSIFAGKWPSPWPGPLRAGTSLPSNLYKGVYWVTVRRIRRQLAG